MDSLPGAARAFSADATSVLAARQFLTTQLRRWDCEAVLWAAVQAVSELATNCVLHAHTEFSVGVHLLADGALRLEVADGVTAPPRARHFGPDATTGRGVTLVAGLARSWGVEPRPDGKTVWCEIDDRPTSGGARDSEVAQEVDLDAFLSSEDRADDMGPAVFARTPPFVLALRRAA